MIQVSVIIINYNTFDLTCAAIKSVINKTINVSYEIILVDNASIECDAEDFKNNFPEITLIKSPVNLGFAKGNNLGITFAKGEVILLLNSDAALINNAILICLNKLNSEKQVGVVSSKLMYPNGDLQYQCGKFPSIKLQLLEFFRIQKLMSRKKRGEVLLGSFFSHEYEISPDWVWGTFFMIKREVITKMPGLKLPEDFFMYAEDLQWCYLIKKLGYSILYEPKALVLHHFSQSTRKNKFIKQKLIILENEDIFLKMNYGEIYTKTFYLLKILNLCLSNVKNDRIANLKNIYLNLLFNKKINT